MHMRIAFLALIAAAFLRAQIPCPEATGTMERNASSIGGIRDGAELTGSESWYDAPNETIRVSVLQPTSSDCQVYVQGMIPQLRGSQWVVDVPVGYGYSPLWPTSQTVYQGLRFWEIPYISALSDPHRVHKPIIYELVRNGQVLVRNKIVIIDKRRDGTFTTSHTARVSDTAGVELTQSGADKLEPVHMSTLPQPTLREFNEALTSRFEGEQQLIEPETYYSAPGKACIPLSSADPDFQATSAYAGVFLLSLADYQIWNTADTACQLAAEAAAVGVVLAPAAAAAAAKNCAIAASMCVRDSTPSPSNFELCAGRISGISKSLATAGVSSTDLFIDNASPLNSQISVGRLDGLVDGTLGSFFIRWSDAHTGCYIRPSVPLTSGDENRTKIAAWRTCPDLEVDAAWAQSDTIGHALPGTGELIEAGASAELPLFQLDPQHPRDGSKAACAGFTSHVESMLDGYYDKMQSALDGAWLAQHPGAMDDLTSIWETGINETMADVELTMNPKTPQQHAGDRMGIYYDTDILAPLGVPEGIAYSRPGDFPCFQPPSGGQPDQPCPLGMSTFSQPVDASYTVTTLAVNQVLRARYNNLRVTPTFDDLGLPPTPGRSGTDPWEVDGAWLSNLFPAFENLGTTRLRLQIEPVFQPFAYIHPEPGYYFKNGVPIAGSVPVGRAPLTYQIAQYRVSLIGDQLAPDGSTTWATFFVDLYDPDFRFDISPDPAQSELIPAFSPLRNQIFLMVKNQFAGCPTAPINKPGKCGSWLNDLIARTVAPKIESILLDAVRGYPAPVLFDARAKASSTRNFVQSRKYLYQQVMTFYGNLE